MKTPLQCVKDPTGRLDWLAAKLLDRAVEQRGNPVLSGVYQELRVPLEQALRNLIGPRNRKLRSLRKYIAEGQKILSAAQQRRVA